VVESRRDENREKDPLQPEQVVSDRRARRKRKRGEDVVRVSEDELNEAEELDAEDEYDDEEDVRPGGKTASKGAPTRSRREILEARAQAGAATGENLPFMGRVVAYLRGVAAEVQKVTWPTAEDARQLTLIVLGVTVFFSILLGAIDFFYGVWFREGVESTEMFLGIAIPFFLIVGFLGWRFIIREEA